MELPVASSSDNNNEIGELALTGAEQEHHHKLIVREKSLTTAGTDVWDRTKHPRKETKEDKMQLEEARKASIIADSSSSTTSRMTSTLRQAVGDDTTRPNTPVCWNLALGLRPLAHSSIQILKFALANSYMARGGTKFYSKFCS
jgi:hypothetical protein